MSRLRCLLEGPALMAVAAALAVLALCAPYADWVLRGNAAVTPSGVTAGMLLHAACFYAVAAHGWACSHGPVRDAGVFLGTVMLFSGAWRLL